MSKKIEPKTTKHFNKVVQNKKESKNVENKPVYKMKMFNNVDSKVKDNLKNFKTYSHKEDKYDKLINNLENELKEN